MERQRKRELRDLNARSWAGDREVFEVSGNLDSSMKKNTTFIRRLRTPVTASSSGTILQEIRTLSLHKYLSEIISACYEGLTKLKTVSEIAAGIEIFSALHQRFGPEEFTSYIGWLIGRGLTPPDKAQLKSLPQDAREKEEKDRLARHKVLLRVSTELWLVGALRSLDDVSPPQDAAKPKDNKITSTSAPKKDASATRHTLQDAEPFPLEVLKELLGQDGQHTQISMIASYLKLFSWDLLGKQDAEIENSQDMDPSMVSENMQQRFRSVFVRYFEGAKLHLGRDQTTLNTQSKRNAEAYVRSGEIFEDRQANYEKMVKAQEKFVTSAQTLAVCLDLEMPNLQEKDSFEAAADGSIGLVKTGEFLRGEGDGAGIWDDEDERRFYENLIDLKDRVPGILLDDGKKKKGDVDEQVGKKPDGAPPVAKDSESKESADAKEVNGNDSTAIANKTVGAQVDALLARLLQATNKEAIDEIAIDFCFVNSKASRNRLIKAVQEVPRGRTDLLPLYSRLVTTLGKHMQDITQSLVSHLDDEFRSLQRRKQKDSLTGVRTSNIRYLAELTKFGLVPEHVIFHCLKVSLEDFSKMNIEIICNLLENCGKYLLRNPETQPRMKSFLETLSRKKGAQHLAQQERMLIENALYSVDPPERAAIQQKERSPMELFVRKLIYDDLNRRNAEHIIKQLRKLHWNEESTIHIVHQIFTKPARIKHPDIHLLAIILGSLGRYYQDFVIAVIDDLLESIRLGLELNEFRDNQKRMAEIRYLGDLYAFRMVDSSVIFDILYKLVALGHDGWPRPDSAPLMDPPDDFFRVRLICTLVEICGTYFDKGAIRKKFDFFLKLFQYYIFTKETMPMDISFAVHDAFRVVRPGWKLPTNLEQAGSLFAEACRENYQATSAPPAPEPEDAETEEADGDIDGEGAVKARRPGGMEEAGSAEDGEDEHTGDHFEAGSNASEGSNEDEEHIIVTRPEDERDPEADAEFDRNLAMLMAESNNEARKTERKPMIDIALPMRRMQQREAGVSEGDAPETNGHKVQFSLLSKKGNRPQTRAFDLPSDSSFAVEYRTQVERQKAEQQHIKRLVLNYDLSQTASPGDATADGINGDYESFYSTSSQLPPLEPNINHTKNRLVVPPRRVSQAKCNSGLPDKPLIQPPVSTRDQGSRKEKDAAEQNQKGSSGTFRRQQARKLQMSDVDWYAPHPAVNSAHAEESTSTNGHDHGRRKRVIFAKSRG